MYSFVYYIYYNKIHLFYLNKCIYLFESFHSSSFPGAGFYIPREHEGLIGSKYSLCKSLGTLGLCPKVLRMKNCAIFNPSGVFRILNVQPHGVRWPPLAEGHLSRHRCHCHCQVAAHPWTRFLSSHFTFPWGPGGQNFIHTLFIIWNSLGHNLLLHHNLFPPGCVLWLFLWLSLCSLAEKGPRAPSWTWFGLPVSSVTKWLITNFQLWIIYITSSFLTSGVFPWIYVLWISADIFMLLQRLCWTPAWNKEQFSKQYF